MAAFTLSWFLAGTISEYTGNTVLEMAAVPEAEDGTDSSSASNNTYIDGPVELSAPPQTPDHLAVGVQPEAFLLVILAGSLLMILAVIITCTPVLRLKPRDILTTMS